MSTTSEKDGGQVTKQHGCVFHNWHYKGDMTTCDICVMTYKKWTKERRAKFMATLASKKRKRSVPASSFTSSNSPITLTVTTKDHDNEVIHLAAELLRGLPDEVLVGMVKTRS